MIIDGVMLLWFGLTALSVAFVAVDISATPENPVLKWGFVLVTLYSGPFGAFLYVLGCREPLPGLHARYVAVRWRQVLGSTMHCVAGDGVGILAGALVGAAIALGPLGELALEYLIGFAFGWAIFQALFMREMAGGSYLKSLRSTFLPELLSMNCLMGGMIPVMSLAFAHEPAAHDPTSLLFWFRMSLALMIGLVAAYPMNWWLVANHLKHGMMTVRRAGTAIPPHDHPATATENGAAPASMTSNDPRSDHAARPTVAVMTVVSFLVLVAGLLITLAFGGFAGA